MSRPKSLFTSNPAGILTRAEAESLAHRTLAFAKADETAVSINSDARANTRFAVNQVSTAGNETDTTITVRSSFGKRSASVTTNKADGASLAAAVKAAEELARLSAENPERMPDLGPQTYPPERPQTISFPSANDRARAVKSVTDRARAAGFVATGYIEARVGTRALANSRGLFGFEQTGGASMTATVRTPDGTGSGWGGANANDWSGIDADAVGATATEKAGNSRNPVAIEPGRYTVVLEPTAVGNLIPILAFSAQARAADEGRSFFSKPGGGNKIGMKIADERVTLVSDPADNIGSGITQDGRPSERVVLIEDGVLKNLIYDRYWADKQSKAATALAFGSIRLSGGNSSVAQMIASTERGVLVTRFWYIRPVDARTILYTGLTRDGTFLIENGKVTHAIKNFRYNESPVFMLNNVDAFGAPVRVSASEDSSPGAAVIMPPLKIHDFNFTSLSDAV
ncbi:MAG: TldD/PmbA family protein [Gemmatimonadota bacterium]|nr:TldD/PmbA family protein [Gemmatimonadota bacterium]